MAALVLFCEGYEHRRTAPRGPTFGGPIGDSENPGYLCVGEPLHVPQDQRGPVLGTHVAERGLYLLPLLRTKECSWTSSLKASTSPLEARMAKA